MIYNDRTYAVAAVVGALVVACLFAWLYFGDVEIARAYWQH